MTDPSGLSRDVPSFQCKPSGTQLPLGNLPNQSESYCMGIKWRMTVSFFYPLQPAPQIHGRILRNPSRACRASRPFVDPFCPDRTRMVYSPLALIILSFVALSMPPCRCRPAEPWYRRKISTWNISPEYCQPPPNL